jgi:hypothetical protein
VHPAHYNANQIAKIGALPYVDVFLFDTLREIIIVFIGLPGKTGKRLSVGFGHLSRLPAPRTRPDAISQRRNFKFFRRRRF